LTAVGTTDAQNDSVMIQVGVPIPAGSATVTPIVDYRYARTEFDAYTESGAAGGNVAVPSHRVSANLMRFGTDASFRWGKIVPTFHAAYHTAFNDDPRSLSLTLASASAVMATEALTVPTPDRDFGSAGLDLQGVFGNERGLWRFGYTFGFG